MNDPQIIVFTGATTGLGKVAAIKALNEGNKLIVLARNSNKASELLTDFKKSILQKKPTLSSLIVI